MNDVYFPNWSSTPGWRPTGLRRDLLNLHRAVTVYYAYGTRRLAYTILSAPALAQPAGAVTVENGMTVRTLRCTAGCSSPGGVTEAPHRPAARRLVSASSGANLRTRRCRPRCSRVVMVASRTSSARAASR